MTDHLSDAAWFKSSQSGGDRNCVEVAFLADGTVGIRDSKNPAGAPLVVDPAMWSAFTATIARSNAVQEGVAVHSPLGASWSSNESTVARHSA